MFLFLAVMLMLKVRYVDPKFIAENISAFYQQSSSNQGYTFPLTDGEWSMTRPPGVGRLWQSHHGCSNMLSKNKNKNHSSQSFLPLICWGFSLFPLFAAPWLPLDLRWHTFCLPASCHCAHVQTQSPLMSSILWFQVCELGTLTYGHTFPGKAKVLGCEQRLEVKLFREVHSALS